MLQINDIIVTADLQTIMETLRAELKLKFDLDRFDTFKETNTNIQTNCPFHKGGQERKPSFGINKETGQCHCFTCGWAGMLDEVISTMFGKDDYGKFGRKWLVQHFNSMQIETRPAIEIKDRRQKEVTAETYITEEELDTYRYSHPYHYRRNLDDYILTRFDIGYDKLTKCITFPVWDVNGNCVFVARRSVNGKYFNYPSGAKKPVYLANEFVSGDYKQAVICEGFLDALVCWKHDIPAMALIGLGSDTQYEILRNLPVRKYILALDPDEAGRRGQYRFRKALSRDKIITEWQYNDSRDINELDEEILNLKEIL